MKSFVINSSEKSDTLDIKNSVIQSPVLCIELSSNKKIGKCSATYASFNSCPSSCPWMKTRSCYAMSGPVGIHTSRITKSEVVDPNKIAEQEAQGIMKLSGKLPLRIHVSGDCNTDYAASQLAKAYDVYKSKHNQKAWTYTHNHQTKRSSWGNISVLRSCENITQVKQAWADGFAASMVVEKFDEGKSTFIGKDIKTINCPEQAGKAASCVECKLCWNDSHLLNKGLVILFASHGTAKKKMLPVFNS